MSEIAGPLSGLRVMDVSIMAAGPWTAALLGMLGAEVIKVEPPTGDGTRWTLPTQRGMGTNFISMNVNKKDIILDSKTDDGRAAALALAATCDIFVQNFRVGVVERLGLDYETLHRINPRMIYCSISGFGEVGPLAKAGCGDPIMQAFSGFAAANGAPADQVEAFRFTGFLDLTTSSVATEAVLAALLERDITGQGQKVELSMLDASLEMQYTRISELLGAGLVARPRGSESAMLVPDRAFRAIDQEVFVTVHDEREWKEFCAAVDAPELVSDSRFATNRLRVANREALGAILEPIFLKKGSVWWLRVFRRHGVACVIAQNFETYRHHRQVYENDMIATMPSKAWGEISVGGVPWHFSDTPCRVTPPSIPGEDTEAVLKALGLAVPAAEPAKTRRA
jgi:crotonobetainyl-CoA:carnitine CoA-transferase CaiB-like acyl-CoA transferase